MKNKLVALIVSSLVAFSSTALHAADPAGGKPVRGKVSAVADGSITVSSKKGGDQTFKTDANTKFAQTDGTAITLSDIKAGTQVMIKPGAAEGIAAKVTAIVPKKKDKGEADAKAPAQGNSKKQEAPAPTPQQ